MDFRGSARWFVGARRIEDDQVKLKHSKKLAGIGAIAAVGLTAACGTAQPEVAAEPARGSVVSVVPVADLAADEVSTRLQTAGIDAAQVRFGVSAQRVVYRTIGTNGEPTTASQLVAFPKNEQSDLGVVSWLHGTTVYRGDVASMKEQSTDRMVALLFAATGQAVSAPDYLGLGEGPGPHPYGHPEATVSAALDGLRAAKEVAGSHGRTFDERVRISGFSQGGPAAMMVAEPCRRAPIPRSPSAGSRRSPGRST